MGREVEVVTHLPTVAADLFFPSENQVLYPDSSRRHPLYGHAALREIKGSQVIFNLYSGNPTWSTTSIRSSWFWREANDQLEES